jgi:hypothetical protein
MAGPHRQGAPRAAKEGSELHFERRRTFVRQPADKLSRFSNPREAFRGQNGGKMGALTRPRAKREVASKYADFCIYVSKRDSGRVFFHIVEVLQNFIAFRYNKIRKFLSFFALFPTFSFPHGRLPL